MLGGCTVIVRLDLAVLTWPSSFCALISLCLDGLKNEANDTLLLVGSV